jgi:hypothetical protein
MHTQNDSRTLLVIGASQHDAAAYHLSGFLAPDPVVALRVKDASEVKTYLAVSSMEYGRAKREARADEVLSFDELGVTQLARELKSGGRALAAASANLLEELGAAGAPVAVPPSLDLVYADELRARGLDGCARPPTLRWLETPEDGRRDLLHREDPESGRGSLRPRRRNSRRVGGFRGRYAHVRRRDPHQRATALRDRLRTPAAGLRRRRHDNRRWFPGRRSAREGQRSFKRR